MSDISKTGNLKRNFDLKERSTEVSQEKLKEVSDMYEKYFIKEMMKQMKKTVSDGTGMFKKNNAEKIFQDRLDDEYSAEWNKQGSFGLSQLIYEQLDGRFGEAAKAKKLIQKPEGPIELNQKSEVKNLNSTGDFSLQINSNHDGVSQAVKTPWAGTLQSKDTMDGDLTVYRIKHDNGLESLISIQGAAGENSRFLTKGDYLQAGDELGRAAVTSPLFWTVRANKEET